MSPERKQARVDSLTRLVANKDFQSWLFVVLEEFCAFEQGFGHVDDFHQGIRAAGSWMMGSLRDGDKSADMLARLYARHFGKQDKRNKEENK